MLAYGHPDGYFMMARERSPPSIYVTAFALETLTYSMEAEWENVLFIGTSLTNGIGISIPLPVAFEHKIDWDELILLEM